MSTPDSLRPANGPKAARSGVPRRPARAAGVAGEPPGAAPAAGRRPEVWYTGAGRAHTWVVDVANVVGARPDGWWRDRAGAADRLLRRIHGLLAAPPPELAPFLPARIVCVLEGAARQAAAVGETAGPGTTVAVVHAVGSGDDAVVETVRTADGQVLVVTSDRGLRTRVHALSATTVGSGTLWRILGQAAT